MRWWSTRVASDSGSRSELFTMAESAIAASTVGAPDGPLSRRLCGSRPFAASPASRGNGAGIENPDTASALPFRSGGDRCPGRLEHSVGALIPPDHDDPLRFLARDPEETLADAVVEPLGLLLDPVGPL